MLVLPVHLVASWATANAYGSTSREDCSFLPSKSAQPWLLRIVASGNEETVHAQLALTCRAVHTGAASIVRCLASHAIFAPRPERGMCELVGIVLLLAEPDGNGLYFVRSEPFLAPMPVASVWPRDRALNISGVSTADAPTLVRSDTVARSLLSKVASTHQPGNLVRTH